MHVGHKAFGRGLEQAFEMLFCRKPRVECLGVFHVTNMLAYECFVAAQQTERVLLFGTSGKQYVLEGCLSVPNKWGYVTRPNKCKFRAQNRKGEWYEMTLSGLGAQCVCHENAHLDGQLFIDVVEEFVDPEDLEEA